MHDDEEVQLEGDGRGNALQDMHRRWREEDLAEGVEEDTRAKVTEGNRVGCSGCRCRMATWCWQSAVAGSSAMVVGSEAKVGSGLAFAAGSPFTSATYGLVPSN